MRDSAQKGGTIGHTNVIVFFFKFGWETNGIKTLVNLKMFTFNLRWPRKSLVNIYKEISRMMLSVTQREIRNCLTEN